MWGRDPDLEDSLHGAQNPLEGDREQDPGEQRLRVLTSHLNSLGTLKVHKEMRLITLHNNGIAPRGPWGFHQGHADVCHHEEQPCIYTSETVPGQLVSRRVCGQMAQSDFSGSQGPF